MSQDARRDEESATERRARILGMAYLDTSQMLNKPLFRDLLTLQELYQMRVIPVDVEKSQILFGITTTTSQQTIRELQQRFTDYRISFAIMSDVGYREYMRLYDPPKEVTYQDISIAQSANEAAQQTISDTFEQVRSEDILAYLVKQAFQLKASDIHLENQADGVRIRFRVDGVLHTIAMLSRQKYHILVSTIAAAANVSTDVPEPQSGHINKQYRMATGEEITANLRVETVPTAYGQDVVMRLFNMKVEYLNLDKLGLSESERKVVDDVIQHPTGLVLIVGPTGSGKTTTLYSLLTTLNSDERKIITLEDPVEYFMPGVVQIPVAGDESATGFGERLRAVLRLDPDIVMVGEIRDPDTAKTALQAALTGHLVLSTFHASSTSAALTRLIDFVGLNPLFASAIHLIMAQRLIRRLDQATRQPYKPDASLLAQLQAIVDSLPPHVARPSLENLTLYKPGKSDANPYGYSGQVAIREQMQMTPGVQQLLRLPPAQVTSDILEKRAIEDGMITMLQDGILKVIAGITTLEEVYRVVG